MRILLGYTDIGYRVLINNKITVVDIIKQDVKCIGFENECYETLQIKKKMIKLRSVRQMIKTESQVMK